MENEELVVNEYDDDEELEEEDMEEEEDTGSSGLALICGMALGSGLAFGGIALFKKLREVIARRRDRKIVEADFKEVNDNEDAEAEVKSDDQTDPKKKSKAK